MKKSSFKFAQSSLCAATLLFAGLAHADQIATAPTLEGGVTASIGTMYVVPSAANHDYTLRDLSGGGDIIIGLDSTLNGDAPLDNTTSIRKIEPDFDFGLMASLGYVFDNTANGIELAYRGLSTSDSSTSSQAFDPIFDFASGSHIAPAPIDQEEINIKSSLDYDYHALDLMISQYFNLGEHMQLRFSGGLAFVDLEQKQRTQAVLITDSDKFIERFETDTTEKSDFSGLGPRVGVDARYDFGQGFGIVGGASLAYFLGDQNTKVTQTTKREFGDIVLDPITDTVKDSTSNHSVTNLRGNLGLDYVYYFDNAQRSVVGIEVGYLVDWYDDIVGEISANTERGFVSSFEFDTHAVTFSGPYLLLKGAF